MRVLWGCHRSRSEIRLSFFVSDAAKSQTIHLFQALATLLSTQGDGSTNPGSMCLPNRFSYTGLATFLLGQSTPQNLIATFELFGIREPTRRHEAHQTPSRERGPSPWSSSTIVRVFPRYILGQVYAYSGSRGTSTLVVSSVWLLHLQSSQDSRLLSEALFPSHAHNS